MSDSVDGLKAMLNLARQSPADKADEQFYGVMLRAKETFGETGYLMAQFYYEYAHFILERIEKNLDIFNNAAVPEADEVEELDNIPEDYEDSENDGSEQLPIATAPIEQEPVVEEDKAQDEEAQEEDLDDKQICYCNLTWAIRIYEVELQKIRSGQTSEASMDDVLNGLRRCRTRLGDIYMMDQEYIKCREEYRRVIEQEEGRPGAESSRLLAELRYLVGNSIMYQNAEGCEVVAVGQYIQAVGLLVSHLALVQNYDVSDFELPTSEHYKVDRFSYLSKPGDSQIVKEIKDVSTCLLDRIEDTLEQIGQREIYESEKKKVEEERKMSEFKPVAEEVKVVNLGSFGNRKRKPETPIQTSPISKEEETTTQATSGSKLTANSKPETQQ